MKYQSIDFAGANVGPIDPETERLFNVWRACYIRQMNRAREVRGWTGKEFCDFWQKGILPEREQERAAVRKPGWSDKEYRDYFWYGTLPEREGTK